jgi:hypothetical protein
MNAFDPINKNIMNKPKLSKEEVLKLIPATVTDKVIIVGIRGYYQDTMGEKGKNDRGIYDDAMFVISPDHFGSFNANTDPSIVRKGIATLKPGIHIYRKGKHHISSPTGYPALRPANPEEKLPVSRDGQPDGWGIAINIHKGGFNTTSSEGCQTIYPEQWSDFINMVYGEMDRWKQKTIPYVLIEQQ